MRKIILLPLLTLLVTGCASNPSISSQDTSTQDSSESSSESVSSETTTNKQDTQDDANKTKELINQAIQHLIDANGNVNKRSVSVVKEDAFLSDQGYFTMQTKTDGVSKRYVYNDRPLLETQSKAYIFDDGHNKYNLIQTQTSQSSYTDTQFYTVNVFNDPTVEDYKEVYAYNSNFVETFLNLGFAFIEGKVLEEFSQFVGIKDTYTEILGVEDFKTNGVWNLSFKLDVFAPGTKTMTQQIIYNDLITLKDGVIVHVEQEMANQLYVQNEVGRSVITNSTFDFECGEFTQFQGEYLDPANYEEAKQQ